MNDLDPHEVAKRMISEPKFRYEVEARLADQMKPRSHKERLAQLAATMFEIGEANGEVWIWIKPLQTFGIGATFREAWKDAIEEITYALEVLGEARDA